ncbi:MAG TPA: hypothetical protein VGM90_37915 [Kofleriaceae bacterium]|jgi:hypothetical protein
MRQVKGVLFLDYIRMLKAHKGVDWKTELPPSDLPYLDTQIDVAGWYPMETFERMGNLILRFVAGGELLPVRLWGRFSAAQMRTVTPMLLAQGDPIETLHRFKVMRATFFDFSALDILMLNAGEAQIEIRYHMGMPAEEAAATQTMGFFEGLLELAGAKDIDARFREKSWENNPRTVLGLRWTEPS